MIDYNEIINFALDFMKDMKVDFIKMHGDQILISVNLDKGSLFIEIHNKETEEMCNACNE